MFYNKLTTLREMLNECNFNWNSGFIVCKNHYISKDSKILDKEFINTWGGTACDIIVAQDNKGMYVLSTYDGLADLTIIYKDFDEYVKNNKEVPLLGGE